MATESVFLGDGYEFDGVIPRHPGLHPAVTIKYRPCTVDERNRYLDSAARPDKRADVAAALIARHVQTLNGAAVGKEQALRLQPLLLDKIIDFVTGYAGSAEEAADSKN